MLEILTNYLDPGSGSIIIQVIIATLVGMAISVKVFWYKIKAKLSRKDF